MFVGVCKEKLQPLKFTWNLDMKGGCSLHTCGMVSNGRVADVEDGNVAGYLGLRFSSCNNLTIGGSF